MRLYIGRSIATLSLDSAYEIGTHKTKWDEASGFPFGALVSIFEIPTCKAEKILGINLAPGEIRKVKSIKIELEE